MKKKILWLLPVIMMVGILKAGISYTDLVINKTAQGVAFTESIDLKEWSRFSLQAVYEDASLTTDTAIDGEFATMEITVVSYAQLASAKASVTVEIATITGLAGESVVLNGRKFVAGTDFVIGASSTSAALALSVAVNATDGLLATASGSTATVTANDYGDEQNSWPVTTSDSAIIIIGAATFASGVDLATIDFNGTVLTEGTDWDAETSNDVTANNIADAIVANATLAETIISTWPGAGAIAYSTSVAPSNLTWYVNVSSPALTVENNGFRGGIDSEIVASTITATAHGLPTSMGVLFGVTAGTAPQGLIDQTTYYVIKVNDDQYALATNTTNSEAGTEITISTFTGGGTFTFTPLAMTGAPSFKWQQSNDNTNWTDLALSSVTYSVDGNTFWDVGEVDYRYIRINFVAPATGGLQLQVYQSGKRD